MTATATTTYDANAAAEKSLAEMGEGDRARTRIYGNLPTL